MINSTIAKAIKEIPVIPERNYWLVRTNGGAYYSDFVKNGFIAIGYDEVKLNKIESVKTKDESGRKGLEAIVKKSYPKEQRPKYIGNQLWDFAFNLKKGDIVIIPSSSSDRISIGEIKETNVYLESPKSIEAPFQCPYEKRKRVRWLETDLNFHRLDPKLLHFKYTRRTITHIDAYSAALIDRELKSLYVKNDEGHLTFSINAHNHIRAIALFQFWIDIIDISKQYCDENGIPFEKNDIDVRINVQSPGIVEFITLSMAALAVITGVMCVVIGAEYEGEAGKTKLKFKTNGLLQNISDYKDRKVKRDLIRTLNEKAKQMNFNEEEMVKLIEQINKIDEKT